MSFVPTATDRVHMLLIGLLCGGAVWGQSQALCDVLLRPAFHYSTDGTVLVVADSSTTYGLSADQSWDFGDGSGTGLTPPHDYAEPGTDTVCLTLTNTAIGCASTYCRTITVPLDDCGGALDARFIWQRTGLNTAMITDASLVAFTGTRLWEFGDGSTSDEIAPTHTWSLPGPHFVTLTRTQGECAATYGEWVEADGNAGTCGSDLFVDFTVSAFDQLLFFEPSISTTTLFPFASIWSYGDGAFDTTVVADHYYAAPGAYQTCLLVGAMGMQELDTCFSLVCHTSDVVPAAGLGDRDAEGPSIWPNPFVSQVNISVPDLSGPITTTIYDALGREVFRRRSNAFGTVRIDAADLQEGAYILEVTMGNVQHRVPVIKARE
ncbi:MAG TPA: PKD domain-containing protein [Flavobacteriales bacterium]|nr:PKD domain-containing protein [Flavobacteriales bacterium]